MSKLVSSKKRIRYLLASLLMVTLVLATGMVLTANSGNKQVSAESRGEGNTLAVQEMKIDDSDTYAEALMGCKTDDINDTASVVELFEAMDLESVTGEYAVEITTEEGIPILSLTVKTPVQKNSRKQFESNMEKCAQQMLALIPQVGKVQWSYTVVSSKGKEETATSFLDSAEATKSLGKDVRSYGNSKGRLQKLLEKQAEAE